MATCVVIYSCPCLHLNRTASYLFILWTRYGFHKGLLTPRIPLLPGSAWHVQSLGTWSPRAPAAISLPGSGCQECLSWMLEMELEFDGQSGSWTSPILLYFETPVAARDLEKIKTPGCQRPLLLKGWIKVFFPLPHPCQVLCPSYTQKKQSLIRFSCLQLSPSLYKGISWFQTRKP